jgi:hypothetical protein
LICSTCLPRQPRHWPTLRFACAGFAALAAACSDSDTIAPATTTQGNAPDTSSAGQGGSSSAADPSGAAGGPGASEVPSMVMPPLPTTTPSGAPAPTMDEFAQQPAPLADWTIVVYGHGDHNLSSSLHTDIGEMALADLNDKVQVVVLADWNASEQDSEGVNYPDGLELYRIAGGGAEPELLARDPEQNLDDPALLSAFVQSAFTALPARHRGLILWDHGGAWEGGFGSDSQNGTQRGQAMSGPEAARAVAAGLAGAGISASPPLDFFSFDTCLMASAEVLYEFKDVAKLYIGNAELDYGDGWNYTGAFSYIAANPDASIEELALGEVSAWDDQHAEASPADYVLRSHVALDLSRADALAAAAQQLTTALVASPTFDANELARSAFFSLAGYSRDLSEADSVFPHLRDIGQLAEQLGTATSDPAVATAALNLRRAAERMVLASSQGTARMQSRQVGINVEQTLGALLTPRRLEGYAARAPGWSAATNWNQVLAFAARAASPEPPLAETQLVNPEASRMALPTLLVQTEDPTAAVGQVVAAQPTEDGGLRWLGTLGRGTVGAGDPGLFQWNGAVAAFADGQIAPLNVWLDTGIGPNAPTVLSIFGALRPNGPDGPRFPCMLMFDADSAVANALIVNEEPDGGAQPYTVPAQFAAEAFSPAVTFAPIYFDFDQNLEPSLNEGTQMPIPAEGFAIVPKFLDAGQYFLISTVTSIWGVDNALIDTVTLTEPLGP